MLGFGLIAIGFLSLILSLVGLQFAFLTWMDAPGRLFGLMLRLVVIMAGFMILVLARTDFRAESREN